MEKILLIIDSPGDLTKEQVEGMPIWVAPVRITYEGKERLEYYEIDRQEYWKDLDRLEEIPATAQITPPQWMQMYQNAAAADYTHVLVYTLSGTASGIYNASCMAAQLYREENPGGLVIDIIDSRSYSFIYGRNILKAAQMVEDGLPFAQICDSLRELTRRSNGILWVYTLRHMRKSGRISGVAAFVGETLGLRPLLLIKDGYIGPIDKVRGDRNVVPRAVELVKKYAVNPQEQVMEILYSDVPQEEIDLAVKLVREELNPKEIVLQPIGCAIATNCGPTAMAICFYGEPFELG